MDKQEHFAFPKLRIASDQDRNTMGATKHHLLLPLLGHFMNKEGVKCHNISASSVSKNPNVVLKIKKRCFL